MIYHISLKLINVMIFVKSKFMLEIKSDTLFFLFLVFSLLHFFYQTHKLCLIIDIVVSQCLVVNIQIFLIVAAFSSNSFSIKRTLPVKNSYLLTFLDDKAEILAACLS